jgi:hypothetical protein
MGGHPSHSNPVVRAFVWGNGGGKEFGAMRATAAPNGYLTGFASVSEVTKTLVLLVSPFFLTHLKATKNCERN